MTDVSQDFLHELLRRFHQRFDRSEQVIKELRGENASLRGQVHFLQGDINNVRAVIARLEDRLEYVEKRLELRDLSETPQSPFDPSS